MAYRSTLYRRTRTRSSPIPARSRRLERRTPDLVERTRKRLAEGAQEALQGIAADLAVEANAEFKSQLTDRRRVSEEERSTTLKRTGLDVDTLIDAYKDQLEATPVEGGARVGVDPGEVLVTAGRTFTMDELGRLHEYGSSTVQQRAHLRPTWRRFRSAEGARRARERIVAAIRKAGR